MGILFYINLTDGRFYLAHGTLWALVKADRMMLHQGYGCG